jgi:hypothetical protein
VARFYVLIEGFRGPVLVTADSFELCGTAGEPGFYVFREDSEDVVVLRADVVSAVMNTANFRANIIYPGGGGQGDVQQTSEEAGTEETSDAA